MLRRVLRVLGVTVGVVLSAAPGAFASHGSAASFGGRLMSGTVTMYSSPGDFIGQGVHRVYDSARGEEIEAVAADGRFTGAGSLTVVVAAGPRADGFEFDIAAPQGQLLGRGVYPDARRLHYDGPGHPGLDIWGDGRGCNEPFGSFEVREWELDASGALQRAWVIYAQYCDTGGALFGEVRLGYPPGPVTPSLLRWPETDVGHRGLEVPVVANAGAIADVSVIGAAAADFPFGDDGCSEGGAGRCEVSVGFKPTAPGVREASLRLVDTVGGHTDVPLQGFAYGGVTSLDLVSDNDPIGGGKTYHYGPDALYDIGLVSPSVVSARVVTDAGEWWSMDFAATPKGALVPGVYAGATRYPFNWTGPGLDVGGNSRGCNELDGSFTVHELTIAGEWLRTFSVSFEQHCEHFAEALRGTLKFRAGDTTAPAPWMVRTAPLGAVAGTGAPPGAGIVPPPGAAGPAALAGDERLRTAIKVQGRRHARAAKAFRAVVKRIRRSRLAAVRAAASRLARDLRSYRRALALARPESPGLAAAGRRLARVLTRENVRIRSLQSALRARDLQSLASARTHLLAALAAVDRNERSAARAREPLLPQPRGAPTASRLRRATEVGEPRGKHVATQ